MAKSVPRSVTWLAVVLLAVVVLAGAARAGDSKAPDTKNAAPEANVVSGTVVAADGSPVVGAKVIIYGSGTRWAMSDAKGHFRIEHVYSYPRHIFAYRDNLVAPKMEVPASIGSKPGNINFAPMHLTMTEGHRAKFTLVSSKTGKPVVGAMIRFQYPDFRRLTTDKDGVALAGGMFAEIYAVDIFAEGFERSQAEVDLTSAGSIATCKVELNPGGIIRGVVIDEAGKPVAGVDINYAGETCADNWSPDARRTDKDGKFQERFVPLRKQLDMSFSHDKFGLKSFSGDDAILLTSEKPARYLRVMLKHPRIDGSAAGTVTDLFGRPIAEADISYSLNFRFRRGMGRRNGNTTTDVKGQFRLENVTSQPDDHEPAIDHVTVQVSASGYISKSADLKLGTADHPDATVITLDPGHTVLGRIVDDRGKPVAGATIYSYGGESNTSRDDGVFTLDSLPEHPRGQISTPYGETVQNIELQIDTTHVVTYTVPSPGAIAARVVDAETGKAVQKFHVRLDNCSERRPGDRQARLNIEKWWTPGADVDAADGRFKIEPIATSCPVEMVIDAPGYERDVNPRAVAHSLGQATESKIELLPLRASDCSTLDVSLLDYRGNAIPNAQLRLVVSSHEVSLPQLNFNRGYYGGGAVTVDQLGQLSWVDQFVTATTDGNGRHKFTGIVPGRYVQVVYSGNGVPQSIWTTGGKVGPGKKLEATIDVPQVSNLHVLIDRKAIPNVYDVVVRPTTSSESHALQLRPANQSIFEFNDLLPGDYSVTVFTFQKRNQNGQIYYTVSSGAGEQVSIKPGETKELHFPKK